MKVIILAAGMGTRLDSSENHAPKPLTKLSDGITLLSHQLSGLAPYLSLDNVIVVVGYHKEDIINSFPHLQYVNNLDFAKENTSKSLLKALEHIHEDVLWLNGDVLFNPSIIQQILLKNQTCMVVNKAQVGEEEVKYRTNDMGHIIEVSKQVKNGEGEALGINFFKKQDLSLLKKHLASCQPNDYFEKGIEESIKEGLKVIPIVVGIDDCVEIDFPEDLAKANKLLYKEDW